MIWYHIIPISQVQISESRKLTKVNVPPLRRHEISIEGLNDNKTSQYVQIRHLDEGKVKVQYRPNVKKLQRLLKSNHALQFSVQYDVERNEKGGEMEVNYDSFIRIYSFLNEFLYITISVTISVTLYSFAFRSLMDTLFISLLLRIYLQCPNMFSLS